MSKSARIKIRMHPQNPQVCYVASLTLLRYRFRTRKRTCTLSQLNHQKPRLTNMSTSFIQLLLLKMMKVSRTLTPDSKTNTNSSILLKSPLTSISHTRIPAETPCRKYPRTILMRSRSPDLNVHEWLSRWGRASRVRAFQRLMTTVLIRRIRIIPNQWRSSHQWMITRMKTPIKLWLKSQS